MEENELQQGKIYFLTYGGNTQIVGRLKEARTMEYVFYDLIHYWNGFESFRKGEQPCVKSGITEIRPATKAEKSLLFRFELEHDCV